jgi:hypothetical protein
MEDIMDFEEWYNKKVRAQEFVFLYIMQKGRKLKNRDCALFWTTYKEALKLAYEAGARTTESEGGGRELTTEIKKEFLKK